MPSRNLDLFTPQVPQESFHPAFREVSTNATDNEKAVLNEWARNFIDRDGKFVKEFQTSFDSSFWELYLFSSFKELGMNCDFRHARPDFCIQSPVSFSVEATVSLNSAGTPSVLETDHLKIPTDINELNRQAMIRLLNSLHSKHKKYLESYSRLAHVKGNPFVLAIAPFDQPHFQLQTQRAIEAVLYRSYVDEDEFLHKSPGSRGTLVAKDMLSVTKHSGKSLPLGVFCSPEMAAISAVIQSTSGTWSKVTTLAKDPDVMVEAVYENRSHGGVLAYIGPNSKYVEGLLDGLRVYHNPFATYPLDPSLFRSEQIFQASAIAPAKLVCLYESTKHLACRKTTRFPLGTMEKVLHGTPADKDYWHAIPQHKLKKNDLGRLE